MTKFIKMLWKIKKMNGCLMLRTTYYELVSATLDTTMGMEELTGFGMKNSLTLTSSANKYFNSFRDENDEPVYTYTDPFKRNFLRQSLKGGRCNAFIQHYKSEISDEVFNIFSKELNVNGNICDLLEKYFEFLNKYEKQCNVQKNTIQNMMITGIVIKKKKLIILKKISTCYQFIKNCLN